VAEGVRSLRYRGLLRGRDLRPGLPWTLAASVALHTPLLLALVFGWAGQPEARPLIDRDVYMVSAVLLPKSQGLPDKAAAPRPPDPGQKGKAPEPPPDPKQMVLKEKDAQEKKGPETQKPRPEEPDEKKKKKPSKEDLLARVDEESDEPRFETSPEGDENVNPDAGLRALYGRQLSPWERQVRDAVQYNWFPKSSAGTPKDDAWAAVGFTVDEQGNILEPALDHESGDLVYDQSCLRAVIRTRRVPPPPPDAARSVSVGFSPKDKQ
jgi:TonB family protein